jgi:hypothetical protein
MSKHTTNGATDNPFGFLTDNAATPSLSIVRANAGGYRQWLAQPVTLGVVQEHVVSFPGSLIETMPSAYINAVAQSVSNPSGTGTGAVTGSAADLRVGRRADDIVQLDGTIIHAAIWSRALSAADILWLYTEPYAMLRPIVRRRYFVPAAGAVSPPLGRRMISWV